MFTFISVPYFFPIITLQIQLLQICISEKIMDTLLSLGIRITQFLMLKCYFCVILSIIIILTVLKTLVFFPQYSFTVFIFLSIVWPLTYTTKQFLSGFKNYPKHSIEKIPKRIFRIVNSF